MDSLNLYKKINIPEIFYSTMTNQPFTNCTACDTYLLDDEDYLIEKAFKHNKKYNTTDVIFEYAMCFDCFEDVYSSLSEESRSRLEEYYRNNVDFAERRQRNFAQKELDTSHWLSHCLIKNTSIDPEEEYQIAGEFLGNKIVLHDFPFALSEKALEDMVQLLSNKTIDQLDDFSGEYLGPPPEFADFFKKKRILII